MINDAVVRAATKLAAKVASLYQKLDWRWYDLGGNIPSEQDIYRTLIELYDHLQDIPELISSGTGGLEVGRENDGYFFSFTIKEYV